MNTQLMTYIIGIAAVAFGVGHGLFSPFLNQKDLDPHLILIIKHVVSFTLLFLLGAAVMIFKF